LGYYKLQHYTKKALTVDDSARAQSAALSDQTQSVSDYLHSHHGNSGKTERASQALQHHAKKLQTALGAAKDEHDTHKLTRAATAFAALQKTIEQTGTGQ